MTFTSGEKLRASAVNEIIPLVGRVAFGDDLTKTSDTTLADVTGLSVAVEANTDYIMDGYLAYNAAAVNGDLKVAISVPTGTTGHWGLYPLTTGSTGGAGTIDGTRITAFGDVNTQAAGGSGTGDTLFCLPRGYISVSTTAGTLQFRAAQNVSDTESTTVVFGSWIRLLKVS